MLANATGWPSREVMTSPISSPATRAAPPSMKRTISRPSTCWVSGPEPRRSSSRATTVTIPSEAVGPTIVPSTARPARMSSTTASASAMGTANPSGSGVELPITTRPTTSSSAFRSGPPEYPATTLADVRTSESIRWAGLPSSVATHAHSSSEVMVPCASER